MSPKVWKNCSKVWIPGQGGYSVGQDRASGVDRPRQFQDRAEYGSCDSSIKL